MEKRMKGSYTRRSSESRWPRVMRWRPARAQRSVDRGARRPAIEPRNGFVWGADALGNDGRQHCWRRFSRAVSGPRGVEEPVHVCDLSMFENRERPRSPVLADDAPSFMDRGVAPRRVAGRTGKAEAEIP